MVVYLPAPEIDYAFRGRLLLPRYRTYQWNIIEAFRAQNIFVRKSVFFGYELKLLISTAGGRFPRAWLEPPCASHSGVSRLMLFPQMFSVGRVIAMVFDGTSSAQSQTQESPPSVPINDAVLRIMNKLKRLWIDSSNAVNDNDNLSQQMKYARLLGEMRQGC